MRLFFLFLYALYSTTLYAETSTQAPFGASDLTEQEAKFLYDLALNTYPPDEKPKEENKVEFNGGCLYYFHLSQMKFHLDFCESYMGRLNPPLHTRLSLILLKYQPLLVHQEREHRYASAKYTCLRYKKNGIKYYCTFFDSCTNKSE